MLRVRRCSEVQTSGRVHYTALAASPHLLALGSNTGSVSIFVRSGGALTFGRLIRPSAAATKKVRLPLLGSLSHAVTGARNVTSIAFSLNGALLAVGYDSGLVVVLTAPILNPAKPEGEVVAISLSHADCKKHGCTSATVTALSFNVEGEILISGGGDGLLAVTPILQEQASGGGGIKSKMRRNLEAIVSGSTVVPQPLSVQRADEGAIKCVRCFVSDRQGETVLIAGESKAVVGVLNESGALSVKGIGKKPRKGPYGVARFGWTKLPGMEAEEELVLSARPPRRLLLAKADGSVLSTLKFPKLPPAVRLAHLEACSQAGAEKREERGQNEQIEKEGEEGRGEEKEKEKEGGKAAAERGDNAMSASTCVGGDAGIIALSKETEKEKERGRTIEMQEDMDAIQSILASGVAGVVGCAGLLLAHEGTTLSVLDCKKVACLACIDCTHISAIADASACDMPLLASPSPPLCREGIHVFMLGGADAKSLYELMIARTAEVVKNMMAEQVVATHHDGVMGGRAAAGGESSRGGEVAGVPASAGGVGMQRRGSVKSEASTTPQKREEGRAVADHVASPTTLAGSPQPKAGPASDRNTLARARSDLKNIFAPSRPSPPHPPSSSTSSRKDAKKSLLSPTPALSAVQRQASSPVLPLSTASTFVPERAQSEETPSAKAAAAMSAFPSSTSASTSMLSLPQSAPLFPDVDTSQVWSDADFPEVDDLIHARTIPFRAFEDVSEGETSSDEEDEQEEVEMEGEEVERTEREGDVSESRGRGVREEKGLEQGRSEEEHAEKGKREVGGGLDMEGAHIDREGVVGKEGRTSGSMREGRLSIGSVKSGEGREVGRTSDGEEEGGGSVNGDVSNEDERMAGRRGEASESMRWERVLDECKTCDRDHSFTLSDGTLSLLMEVESKWEKGGGEGVTSTLLSTSRAVQREEVEEEGKSEGGEGNDRQVSADLVLAAVTAALKVGHFDSIVWLPSFLLHTCGRIPSTYLESILTVVAVARRELLAEALATISEVRRLSGGIAKTRQEEEGGMREREGSAQVEKMESEMLMLLSEKVALPLRVLLSSTCVSERDVSAVKNILSLSSRITGGKGEDGMSDSEREWGRRGEGGSSSSKSGRSDEKKGGEGGKRRPAFIESIEHRYVKEEGRGNEGESEFLSTLFCLLALFRAGAEMGWTSDILVIEREECTAVHACLRYFSRPMWDGVVAEAIALWRGGDGLTVAGETEMRAGRQRGEEGGEGEREREEKGVKSEDGEKIEDNSVSVRSEYACEKEVSLLSFVRINTSALRHADGFAFSEVGLQLLFSAMVTLQKGVIAYVEGEGEERREGESKSGKGEVGVVGVREASPPALSLPSSAFASPLVDDLLLLVESVVPDRVLNIYPHLVLKEVKERGSMACVQSALSSPTFRTLAISAFFEFCLTHVRSLHLRRCPHSHTSMQMWRAEMKEAESKSEEKEKSKGINPSASSTPATASASTSALTNSFSSSSSTYKSAVDKRGLAACMKEEEARRRVEADMSVLSGYSKRYSGSECELIVLKLIELDAAMREVSLQSCGGEDKEEEERVEGRDETSADQVECLSLVDCPLFKRWMPTDNDLHFVAYLLSNCSFENVVGAVVSRIPPAEGSSRPLGSHPPSSPHASSSSPSPNIQLDHPLLPSSSSHDMPAPSPSLWHAVELERKWKGEKSWAAHILSFVSRSFSAYLQCRGKQAELLQFIAAELWEEASKR